MSAAEDGVFALVRSDFSAYEDFVAEAFADEKSRQICWRVVRSESELPAGAKLALQWDEYEQLDWDRALGGERIVSGYVMRNGLTRKAHLAALLNRAIRKNSGCRLEAHVPESIPVEIPHSADRARFCESIESAREAVERRGGLWMLKPSRIDRGDNKYIVSSSDELEAILWREKEMMNWVCQRYIARPLLVDGRKFHLRVNVLAVGALKVFVHRPSVLVNTAALKYSTDKAKLKDSNVHISNAIFARTYHRDGRSHPDGTQIEPAQSAQRGGETRSDPSGEETNRPEWREEDFKFLLPALATRADDPGVDVDALFEQICDVVKDLFATAETDPNAIILSEKSFELFGLDFMVERCEESAGAGAGAPRVSLLSSGKVGSAKATLSSEAHEGGPQSATALPGHGHAHNVLLLEVNAGCDYKSLYLAGKLSTGCSDQYSDALTNLVSGAVDAIEEHVLESGAIRLDRAVSSGSVTAEQQKANGWKLVHDGSETIPPWMRSGGIKILRGGDKWGGDIRGSDLLVDMERRAAEEREAKRVERALNEGAGKRPPGDLIAPGDRFGYWSQGELVACICRGKRTPEEAARAAREGDAEESTCAYGTLNYALEDEDESDEDAWDTDWTDICSERIETDLVATPIGSVAE